MFALRRANATFLPYLTRRGNATLQATTPAPSLPPSLLSSSSATRKDAPPHEAASTVKQSVAAVSEAEPSAKPALPKRGRKQGRKNPPKRRPRISLDHPREWNRPIREGALPVYDEALKIIREDSQRLKAEMVEVRNYIAEAENMGEAERDEEALEKLREKLNILEIQSEINKPAVRWNFANGMGV